jgi:hypothetical protein
MVTSKETLHVDFGFIVDELGMLSTHYQCNKICPKLLKFAQRQLAWGTLKYHPKKWDFGVSQKKVPYVEEASQHVLRVWIFNTKISHMPFSLSKNGLYMWISISPCVKWCFFKGSISLVGMKFCKHVPNSPRNKNVKRLIPCVLEKLVLLVTKTLLFPSYIGGNTFPLILNVMIL